MPLQELVLALDPPAPSEVQDHARALKYRDFITVAVMIRRAEVFLDNWIYVHTPDISVARIQNYKNWSAAMVPDATQTCLGLEYFCSAWLDGIENLQMVGRNGLHKYNNQDHAMLTALLAARNVLGEKHDI